MRKTCILTMLTMCLTVWSCNQNIKQDNTVLDNQPSINITIKTNKEQSFFFYGAGSFVAGTTIENDKPLWMKIDHNIFFDGKTLHIDDEVFQVINHTYREGNVFKDAGKQEVHIITIKQANDSVATISITKVTNEGKTQWIVNIPSYDEMGVLCSLSIYTD